MLVCNRCLFVTYAFFLSCSISMGFPLKSSLLKAIYQTGTARNVLTCMSHLCSSICIGLSYVLGFKTLLQSVTCRWYVCTCESILIGHSFVLTPVVCQQDLWSSSHYFISHFSLSCTYSIDAVGALLAVLKLQYDAVECLVAAALWWCVPCWISPELLFALHLEETTTVVLAIARE